MKASNFCGAAAIILRMCCDKADRLHLGPVLSTDYEMVPIRGQWESRRMEPRNQI